MVFTIEQLNRFKEYARRAMVRAEEWKNSRDVQVQRIAEEIQGAFSEGYHTAMHEIRSTPWEWRWSVIGDISGMNELSAQGWEFVQMASGQASNPIVLWRRRKAVSDGGE